MRTLREENDVFSFFANSENHGSGLAGAIVICASCFLTAFELRLTFWRVRGAARPRRARHSVVVVANNVVCFIGERRAVDPTIERNRATLVDDRLKRDRTVLGNMSSDIGPLDIAFLGIIIQK